MGRHAIPLCGFGQTILYHNFTEFVDYTATMQAFPNMVNDITESNYNKSKLSRRRCLQTRLSYTNTDRERFLTHFDLLAWHRLSDDEKHRHKLKKCSECLTSSHVYVYGTLKRNKAAFPPRVPVEPVSVPKVVPADKENIIQGARQVTDECSHIADKAHEVSMKTTPNK